MAVTAWVASLGGAYVGVRLADRHDRTPPRTPSTLGLDVADPQGSTPPTDVYEAALRVAPSVVSVHVDAARDGVAGQAAGTGIVVTADGEIITNAHVVEGASAVQVRLPGESEPRPAAVLAVDAAHDLALLRIDATGLRPVTFAAPEDLRVGDPVVAVGYALDLDGDPTVTSGIVSALHRTSSDAERLLTDLVQTDAPISSGNSGGPLVNSRGEVVGVTTFVATGGGADSANSLGFAISTAVVLTTVESLRASASGAADRPLGYLGVSLDARNDGGSGALITDVAAGSPADLAGLRTGDAVVDIDGEPLAGGPALAAAVRAHDPGDEVHLGVVRDGARRTVTVVLGERPAD